MRLISKIIATALLIFGSLLVLASSGIGSDYCGTSLSFRYEDNYLDYVSLYDFNTGVALPGERYSDDSVATTPDGNYRYEIPEGRENDIVITNTETDERRLVFRSPYITGIRWSSDSRTLMVWEFDGMRAPILTRLNIESNQGAERYNFVPMFNGDNNLSPARNYFFSTYVLNAVTGTQGLVFIETGTGEITQFNAPTSTPYRWSDNSQWIASRFENQIYIIDPQVNGHHANFPDGIEGETYIWHENMLWFNRSNAENGTNVWRANISDGSIEMMIASASLETIAQDGNHATIYDEQINDIAIYDFLTESRYLLNLTNRMSSHRRTVRYSPNGRCMAIVLREIATPENQTLRVIDLESNRDIQQHKLTFDYELYGMNWIEDG